MRAHVVRDRGLRRAAGGGRVRARGADGFTIIELVIAISLLAMTMLPFAYIMTQSLSQVSFAKQRQTADGLLDQTMEQVRALRYSAIQGGLDTTDLTNNPDSNITASGGVYTFVPNGETIVTAAHSGAVPAPLNPHRSTITINTTHYTISTYPTYFQGGTSTYRVTVIVSWSPSQIHGVSNQVSSQTIVSSPSSGCLSDQTHPFAAPCQPFLYAQATSGNGFIQITPKAGTVGDAISGPNGNGSVPLHDANLFLVQDSSTMQIEQIAKVQGSLQTSSAEINLDTSGTSSGGAIGNAQADNDPATVSNQYSSVQPFQTATPVLSEFGNGNNGNGLTLVTSDNDSGTVVGTTAAALSPSPACTDLTGTFLATVLPCGSASVQQAGTTTSTMAANLVLFAGPGSGSSLGTTQLAAIAPPASPTRMFTSRLTTPSLGYCPTTTGDGCVHAGGQRSIGTATLAGLPSLLGAAPAGWGSGANNYLVQLSGYSDSVAAESGVGTSGSLPSASQTGTPTLRWWNGTGYTTTNVTWGASPPTLSIPPVSVATTFNGQAVTVTITNTLVAGGTSKSTSGSAPCQTSCKATAQVNSPISGHILYTVTAGGQTVASLDIAVNFGTLLAQTNYRAAPLAS